MMRGYVVKPVATHCLHTEATSACAKATAQLFGWRSSGMCMWLALSELHACDMHRGMYCLGFICM